MLALGCNSNFLCLSGTYPKKVVKPVSHQKISKQTNTVISFWLIIETDNIKTEKIDKTFLLN